jgi:hypothetical protein
MNTILLGAILLAQAPDTPDTADHFGEFPTSGMSPPSTCT